MTTKALIVGINDYAPIGPGGPDLRGCVADALDFANTVGNVLHVLPPIPKFMRILLDHQATKARIVDGLRWLVTGTKPEDLRIFFYSGHGTQVIDKWPIDEPDGKDEAIVPHDYTAGGVISDDEIATIFKTLPAGANLEVIVDSCHSGTTTRGLPEAGSVAVRSVDPPPDQAFFLEANSFLPSKNTLKGRGKDIVIVPGLNHVLWAACKDAQLSQELPIAGNVRGAFTYWFCKVLRAAGLGAPRYVIDSQVSAKVKQTVNNQVPQLEAQRTALVKPIFGATKALEGPEFAAMALRARASG